MAEMTSEIEGLTANLTSETFLYWVKLYAFTRMFHSEKTRDKEQCADQC